MNVQTATQKAADTAHSVADGVLNSAKDAVQATRRAANNSLDKAERGVDQLQGGVNPAIDDLAARAQELASRGISYCADASERARRQYNHAAEVGSRYVADQPGKSVLIAAVAGAAIAALFMMSSRRRHDY